MNWNYLTVKFCNAYCEAQGQNKDQFCFNIISAMLKIDTKFEMAVNFWILFIAQSNFQFKVAPK